MPSCDRRLIACLLTAGLITACSTSPDSATYTPEDHLTKVVVEAVTYPLEKTVYWGAWVAIGYLILDPFAPNWEIVEARFPENHIHMQMSMKRYYAGGAGEARQTFHRRARELARTGGFAGYDVVEYSESLDSSVIGSQRKAEGVIRLKRSAG